jgi:hypothetical protein
MPNYGYGGENDYEELLGGVYAGGARTKGAKDKNPRKMSPKTMARIKFTKDYGVKHKLTYKEALVALAGKPTPARYGKTPAKKTVAKKTVAKKSGSKVTKRKTTAKKSSFVYGHPTNPPTNSQLRRLGLNKDEFAELAKMNNYIKNKRRRIGYHYRLRDKNGSCKYPERDGAYFLDGDYNCNSNKAKNKKRINKPRATLYDDYEDEYDDLGNIQFIEEERRPNYSNPYAPNFIGEENIRIPLIKKKGLRQKKPPQRSRYIKPHKQPHINEYSVEYLENLPQTI